jgi:hypothetical protein
VATTAGTTWLTVPDLVDLLGLSQSKVRRLFDERILLAVRVDGEPLGDLRGTLMVLSDAGFSDDEAMHWLLSEEESLGTTPIDALRNRRKSEVRRVAQALGF